MGRTLGTMFTITTYGTWLRGDARGWIDDGKLMPADPELEASDRRRLKHPPYYFAAERRFDVGTWLGTGLIRELGLRLWALAVRSWHLHFVVGPTPVPVGEVAKCAKDQVRYGLAAGRPIWGGDYDKRFCFDALSLRHRILYVERHNTEDGLPPQPWPFLETPW